MAKKTDIIEKSGTQFIDGTDKRWYVKDNSVFLCKSIDEILAGKAESFHFTGSLVSTRTAETKKNEPIERNNYRIFHDGSKYVLVKRWMELK
jgi:hypothetical protein